MYGQQHPLARVNAVRLNIPLRKFAKFHATAKIFIRQLLLLVLELVSYVLFSALQMGVHLATASALSSPLRHPTPACLPACLPACSQASPRARLHQRGGGIAVRASLNQLGDFGARDATASELESKFGDRVLGNASTEHIILIPPHLLGLAERTITPLAEGTEPLSQDSAKALLRKVLAWRLVDEGGLRIECEWKLKSFSAGIELFKRIAEVAEAAGHHPDLHLQQGNRAKVSVWTHSLGGLTENDFILAAKIDRIPTSDLIYKKNKFWA